MNEKEYIDRRMEAYAAEQKEWLADQVAEIPVTLDPIAVRIVPAEIGSAHIEGMERLADALDDWRETLIPGRYVVEITGGNP